MIGSCFVGEDGAFTSFPENINPATYFPTSWNSWTNGIEDRAKWGWKYYAANAQTEMVKGPVAMFCYCIGAMVARWYGNRIWSSPIWKYHKLRSMYLGFINDLESGRTIRFSMRAH